MKLTKAQKKKIIAFSEKHCKKFDPEHDMEHIKRTVRIAEYLGKRMNADMDVVETSAWLHDIGRTKGTKDHHINGADMAKKFLKKNKFEKEFINSVVHCILYHDYIHKGNRKKMDEMSLEAKVVCDADALQCMGPFGFLRRMTTYLNRKLPKKIAYAKSKKKQEQLYNMPLLTAPARSLIKREYLFMLKFYDMHEKWEKIFDRK